MSYFFEMNLWRIKKGTEERLESGQEMLKQIFSKAKISPVGPVRTEEDDTRRNGDTLKYQKNKKLQLNFTTNISIDSGQTRQMSLKWS